MARLDHLDRAGRAARAVTEADFARWVEGDRSAPVTADMLESLDLVVQTLALHGSPGLAATVRALGRHGGYDAAVPVAVQKVVAATLGWVAEALGYRGVAAKYLG